ncbi:MAG: OmpA family protein [Cytophagales bacterium]|nr:OmpA family protein [Cytophagales bacterium]
MSVIPIHIFRLIFHGRGLSPLFLSVLIWVLAWEKLPAQISSQNSDERSTTSDTISIQGSKIINFHDLDQKGFYHSSFLSQRIQELQKAQEWTTLAGVLKRYVSHFRVENFHQESHMLWELAKCMELAHGWEEALPFYRIALRHAREDLSLNELEFYYGRLNQEEIDVYVPLDYYYKLINNKKYMDTIRPPQGKLLNMGPHINSLAADYAPYMGLQNSRLFFSSRRHETEENFFRKRKNEDIFYSVRNSDKEWEKSIPLHEINTEKYNEGSVCIDAAGKHLYFTRCEAPDGYGDCDLYDAIWNEVSQTWTQIRNLGDYVNGPYWDSHPSLSPTGDTLFFASNRIGGFGLSDIYYVRKISSRRWSRAINLGPFVNTSRNEVSPFLHPKRQVLYFSSDGQLFNFGGFDIYKVRWDPNVGWEEPVNVGPLINGKGSEHYFTIGALSHYIYYARSESQRMEGQDLYAFPLPMEGHPDAHTILRGSLTDSDTHAPFQGIVQIVDLDNGREVSPKFLDKDGKFKFRLIDNGNYLLVIEGDDFFTVEKLFFLSGETDLNLNTIPISRKVKFQALEFRTGSAEVLPNMFSHLKEIGSFLQKYPSFNLSVAGHTDARGKEESNLDLSRNRAINIRNYILSTLPELSEDRIQAQGFGSSKPIIFPEITDKDRSVNRRVEFHFYRRKKK